MSRFGSLSVYREPASLRMLFLGFSSGLPLLLVLGTLSFWLRESGIDLKTIGFMSWVGLCWGLKWVWAPLVDRLRIPLLTRRLGRRRAWLLLSQIGLAAGLAAMAFCDPARNLDTVIACALVTAFSAPHRIFRSMLSVLSPVTRRSRPHLRRCIRRGTALRCCGRAPELWRLQQLLMRAAEKAGGLLTL